MRRSEILTQTASRRAGCGERVFRRGFMISDSVAATRRLAARFARQLPSSTIVVLLGEVGSGKTTFVRGFVEALGKGKKIDASSPSFVLLRHYPTLPGVCHADLYRADEISPALWAEMDEAIGCGDIVLIEWGDRAFARYGKKGILRIQLSHMGQKKRRIEWRW